jgi:hypothetical protein
MRTLLRPMLGCVFFAVIGIRTVIAQQQTQAGVATNTRNATVGGTSVSSGSTIFSGDLLKTGEEGFLQVQSGAMHFVFEGNSAARIFRRGNRVIVELERGAVHYSAQGVSEMLTLFAQDIKFIPTMTDLGVGQISIVSHCEVTATAKRSTLVATAGKKRARSRQTGLIECSPKSVWTTTIPGSRCRRTIRNIRPTPYIITLTAT